jgi:hypothetical protein
MEIGGGSRVKGRKTIESRKEASQKGDVDSRVAKGRHSRAI